MFIIVSIYSIKDFIGVIERHLTHFDKTMFNKYFSLYLNCCFRELLTIHNQMRLGKDPQREDSLRSAIAGKRRGIPVETLQVSTPSTAGVRFRGGSDDED